MTPQNLQSCVYVAQNSDDKSQYVVAIAGTQFKSIMDAITQDGFFKQTSCPSASQNWITISEGTKLGIEILLSNPSNATEDAPNPPKLTEILHSLVSGGNNIELMITGHSLGGALSTAMAYLLKQMQTQKASFEDTNITSFSLDPWDTSSNANISLLATASPAIGDSNFASVIQQNFSAESVVWNAIDVVPHAWGNMGDKGEKLLTLYNGHTPTPITPGECISVAIVTVASLVNQSNFVQANPNSSFTGNDDVKIPDISCNKNDGFAYMYDLMNQHLLAYCSYFGQTDLALNGLHVDITQDACNAYNDLCPDAKCDCSGN